MLEILQAISGLWALIVSLLLVGSIIYFRKELRILLVRLTKLELKRGDTTFSLAQNEKPALPELPMTAVVPAEAEKGNNDKKEDILSDETPTNVLLVKMIDALYNHELEQGDELYKRLQDAASDAEDKIRYETAYLFFRYKAGDETALSRLQSLAERAKHTPKMYAFVLLRIGMCFEDAGNFDTAIELYERAITLSTGDNENRASYIEALSRCLYKADKKDEAYRVVRTSITTSTDNTLTSSLYEILADLYDREKNYEMKAICSDKAIEYQPNNTSLLFNAAYSYNKISLDNLSLLLYESLLQFKPNYSSALNNISISYRELGMVGKSTAALKSAIVAGGTLPAASLAYAYLREGFITEALEALEKANKAEDPHPNVGAAFAEAKQQREKEENLKEEALKIARQQQLFIRRFASSYLTEITALPSLTGRWKTDSNIEVTLTEENNKISIEWSGEKKISLKGILQNNAIRITDFFDKTSQYSTITLADRGYGVISNNAKEIDIMTIKNKMHSYMKMLRIQDSDISPD